MRVAIYLRQSLENTEGIERQRERCEAFCLARGWTVVRTFEDNAVSASKSREGAAWGDLLAAVETQEIEAVVAVKVDRLARRVKDILDLTEKGLGIATLEGELDTTTDMGRFQAVLLTALAELEAARKGTRHKEAHVSRAVKGIPRTTKRPYGWQSDGMTLEPEEAEHLRTALRNVLAGESIRGEVRRMNEAGARTVRYKDHKDGTPGSGGIEWTPKALTSILEKPRMAGINTYLGAATEESRIQPIVTREEWEAFNVLRKTKDRLKRAQGDTEAKTGLRYYLSGVAVCTCGKPMRARPVNSRGKKVPYYQCTEAGSGHVAIAAHRAERVVEMWLYGHMSGGWTKAGGTGEKVKAIRAQIKAVEERRDAATELALIPGMNRARITAELAAINAERAKLDADLEKAVSDDYGAEWLVDLMEAGEDSYESADAFKAWFDGLEVERRRALVRGNAVVKIEAGHGSRRVRVSPR